MPNVNAGVTVPEEVRADLERWAAQEGRSRSELGSILIQYGLYKLTQKGNSIVLLSEIQQYKTHQDNKQILDNGGTAPENLASSEQSGEEQARHAQNGLSQNETPATNNPQRQRNTVHKSRRKPHDKTG
jgi:CopG-like RHH_1 or ribbon-helix-helix domain, RHH_5